MSLFGLSSLFLPLRSFQSTIESVVIRAFAQPSDRFSTYLKPCSPVFEPGREQRQLQIDLWRLVHS